MNKENQAIIMKLEELKQDIDVSEDLLIYAQQLLQSAKNEEDSYCQTIAIYFISLYHYKKGDMELCIEYASYANDLSVRYQYHDYIIITNNMLGIIYSTISEQFLGLDYLLKGYYAAEKVKNYDQMSRILNNIGNLFHSLSVYDEALKFLLRAKEYRERIPDYKDEIYGIIMINLIEIYMMQEREEEAAKYIAEIEDFLEDKDRETLKEIILASEILYCYNSGLDLLAKEKIMQLLEKVNGYSDYTHTFTILLRISRVIYHLKDREIGDEYIRIMKLLIDNVENANYHLQYQDMVIEYYDHMKLKEQWYEAIKDYYLFNQKNVMLRKDNYSRSLLAKIELEEAIHEKEEIVQKNKALLRLSEEDELTGIYNRRAAEKKIMESLNNIRDNISALLIIDVDCFKHVNDNHGHMAGDKVLGKVGHLLREYFTENAIVGRLGGDEFIVFISNVSNEVAKARQSISKQIEKFQHELNKIRIKNMNKCISVSVGATLVFNNKTTFTTLYSSSDTALYEAKNNGKNCYVILEEKK